MDQVFTEKQIQLLQQDLDPRFISNRKGGGGSELKYIEGHDAIDQANRLFGYGNWSYRPLSCEQCVLMDPMTGEAVGVSYKAKVELIVRGCVAPIVEVGSQPVATWNVTDTVMGRRKKGDTKEIEDWERVNARRTIVEAHEMAEKGAVTDALKRALRTFGNQFGNGLYGDGPVIIVDGDTLDIETLKADWAKVYNIPQDQVDARWPNYVKYVLGTPVINPDSHQKSLLFADIEKKKKAKQSA
jgi:DNA repair and recombination protein RAD52